MIGLYTPTYDLQGHIILNEDPSSTVPILSRRLTRTATLDGESTINDLGFSYSDGTYVLRFNDLTTKEIGVLEHMIKLHPLVTLTTKEGAYFGAIKSLSLRVQPVELTFLIKKLVSQEI